MALDWARYRSARGSKRARQGFERRPFPARAWNELYVKPVAHMPWPYTDAEAKCISSVLPEECRSRALQTVVLAAR